MCHVAPEERHHVERVHELQPEAFGDVGGDNPFIPLRHRAALFRDAGSHHRHGPLWIPDGETSLRAALCALHR